MLRRHRHDQRRGAALVEAALVYPVLCLLIIGVIVVGLGVVRHNQVALLAREGSRYACVRGTQYATDTGNAAATTDDHTRLRQGQGRRPEHDAGDSHDHLEHEQRNLTHTSGSSTIKNTVSVTVSYLWIPEAYFGGVTLTSTSVMTMSY